MSLDDSREEIGIQFIDRIIAIRDLVEICVDSLTNSRLKNHKELVCNILHFNVLREIENIVEEVTRI